MLDIIFNQFHIFFRFYALAMPINIIISNRRNIFFRLKLHVQSDVLLEIGQIVVKKGFLLFLATI